MFLMLLGCWCTIYNYQSPLLHCQAEEGGERRGSEREGENSERSAHFVLYGESVYPRSMCNFIQ